MKILHLFNQYLPPTENWAYKLIRHTPDTQVVIGAQSYLMNEFCDSGFTFIQHPFAGLRELDLRLDRRRAGHFPKILALKTLSWLLGSAEKEIIAAGRREKIDLVHAHFADVAWMFRQIPKALKVPWVISLYGWDYEKLPYLKPEFENHFREMFQRADALVCEGPHGAEILRQKGCPEEKIKVVPLGIEPDKIPVFSRSKTPGELRLLQIASFAEKKGQLYAVRAMAAVKAECPNARLTLLGGEGDPGWKVKVKEEIRYFGLEDRVQLLDRIDYKRLYAFMNDYQVFIHPSCYAANRDCEGGAPVVLLDAQATGMPVISTRHCDIPQEVIDGETGFLAAEKSVPELADLVRRFYAMDGETYAGFSHRSRHWVEQQFDIRRNAVILSELYRSLL